MSKQSRRLKRKLKIASNNKEAIPIKYNTIYEKISDPRNYIECSETIGAVPLKVNMKVAQIKQASEKIKKIAEDIKMNIYFTITDQRMI